MKILIVSQVFWPDSTSVSQHLADFAEALVVKGHRVEVFSSRRGYEDPGLIYDAKEAHNGIHIKRLRQTAFKKSNKIGRVLNLLTFNFHLLYKLLCLEKGGCDLIIGTTTPPLSSFFNAFASGLKKIPFCHWTMDLQPELSIISGYLRKYSPLSLFLLAVNNYALKRTAMVITLDRYMAEYIVKKGTSPGKVKVVPVWPVLERRYNGPRLENSFRIQHDMGDRIVVMYSGNHAIVHPLNTLLRAVEALRDDPRFLFVFIGGGVRKEEVTRFKKEHDLDNILQLPYQKREDLHLSLSAADLHVVVHGNGCTGHTHPNKIYGAMFAGRPVLYIGPRPSHISDILDECPGNLCVGHGQAEQLAALLRVFGGMSDDEKNDIGARNMEFVKAHLDRDVLIGKIISELETLHAGQEGIR